MLQVFVENPFDKTLYRKSLHSRFRSLESIMIKNIFFIIIGKHRQLYNNKTE